MKQKDIVDHLREWANNAEEQQATVVADGLRMAADEIERLRAEVDDLESGIK